MSERHGVLWTQFFIISTSYICFGLLFERFLFLAWSIQPPTLLSILLLWPSKETNQEDPKKAMQCCNRRLLEFSEIVGKERVQVTFSLELALFQLHWHMANGLSKYTQTRSAFWRYWFYSKAPLWMQHMQITPFSKQPQAGSDCGFATFGKHPTVHPDIVWAKLVFFNSCLFIQLSAAIKQTIFIRVPWLKGRGLQQTG